MHTAIEPSITWGFAGLLCAMIIALALEEKIHAKKSLITGIFAMIALIMGVALHILPLGPVQLPNGHLMEMPLYIPSIDWGVIVIILGSSLFIDVVSRSGIFSWTAIHLTRIYFFQLHFCGRACRDLQNTRFGEVCMY